MKLFDNQLSKFAATALAAGKIFEFGLNLAFSGLSGCHSHHHRNHNGSLVEGLVESALKGSGVSLKDCQRVLGKEASAFLVDKA